MKGSNINNLLVVSFYTTGTPYQEEAKKTIASCEKFNLNYHIVGEPDLGSWQANTRHKADFMLNMLTQFPDKQLLWVDCDAIIQRYPTLFEGYTADIALRYQDFPYRKGDCLSGTIYMENNTLTRELCRRWSDKNKQSALDQRNIEQWNLGDTIQEMIQSDGLVFKNLPPEYTFIFDRMRAIYPDAKPVIEHFQASRKYRRR